MIKRLLLALALIAPIAAFAQSTTPTRNGSVSITTGGTFQTALAANDRRRGLTIQNNNTNNDNCWIYLGTLASATTATAILLAPGGSYQRYYPYIPRDIVNVTCATTSDSIYVDEN